MINFDSILRRFEWREIRNCPGRFVLRNFDDRDQVSAIIKTIGFTSYTLEKVRDKLLVAELGDGGFISYERGDGNVLHTLCNKTGFKRKLKQLELPAKARTLES